MPRAVASRETIAALVASLHERLRAPELRELKVGSPSSSVSPVIERFPLII